MSDQETKPTLLEETNEVEQPLSFGKIRRVFLLAVPLIVVIVIITLALLTQLGPTTDNLYSNIITTL